MPGEYDLAKEQEEMMKAFANMIGVLRLFEQNITKLERLYQYRLTNGWTDEMYTQELFNQFAFGHLDHDVVKYAVPAVVGFIQKTRVKTPVTSYDDSSGVVEMSLMDALYSLVDPEL